MLTGVLEQLGEFQINSYTANNQEEPVVAMDSAGDFVVVWTDSSGQDGSYTGIYAQRYNSAGTAQGSEFQVNSYTTGNQNAPAVATNSSGDFVVTWQSDSQDGDSFGIYGQRYNSTGVTQGSEFQINTYTTGDQYSAAVALDSSGNFVITWQSANQDGSYLGIYAQRYDSQGNTR